MQEIMGATKRELEHALPFAMEPVVYDFAINERGTWAELLSAARRRATPALLPPGYYALIVPELLRLRPRASCRRCAAPSWTASARPAARRPELAGMVQVLFDRLLPQRRPGRAPAARTSDRLLAGTASTARSTSRSAPTCAAGASAWRRTACRSPRDIRDVQPGRRLRRHR